MKNCTFSFCLILTCPQTKQIPSTPFLIVHLPVQNNKLQLVCTNLLLQFFVFTDIQHIIEYYTLARSYHPDKSDTDSGDVSAFHDIAEAYKILSDDDTRALYDTWMQSGLKISFNEWRAATSDSAATMHWVGPIDPAKNAIEDAMKAVESPVTSPKKISTSPPSAYSRPSYFSSPVQRGSLLHQFRTYQI